MSGKFLVAEEGQSRLGGKVEMQGVGGGVVVVGQCSGSRQGLSPQSTSSGWLQ